MDIVRAERKARTKSNTGIRTRYQRMSLAMQMGKLLEDHADPYVQAMGLAIAYTLGAPTSTLNNVLDQFPKQAIALIRKVEGKDEADGLLDHMRDVRASRR